MRCLRRHGRPARPARRRSRWTAINACLVPAAGFDDQEVITAEGLGDVERAAPRAAGDGRPRRLAMRLLHTGFHLLDGLGVLPRRPPHGDTSAAAGASAEAEPHTSGRRRSGRSAGTAPIRQRPEGPRPRARPERLRPARAVRQPVPLHRLSADPGRGVRARRSRRESDPLFDPARPAGTGARHRPGSPAARAPSSGRRTWPRRSTCSPRTRTRSCSPAPPTGASS